MSLARPLSIVELYERWAPAYPAAPHNPLMQVEHQAMLRLWPQTAPRRALDLACGTGRYAKVLTERGAAHVVALDFSMAMLRRLAAGSAVCASMMRLPFAAGTFDAVVSGLAVGHAAAVEDWMLEVARVLDGGGLLLYSDFHPEAARAGLKRSFKDELRCSHTLPHHAHTADAQTQAAARAGLEVEAVEEIRVGVEMQERFPGCEPFYRRWQGLPLVLAVRARKR